MDRDSSSQTQSLQPAVKTAVSDDLPRGMIPRLEPVPSHKRVYDIVAPRFVMVAFNRARQLVKRGETADSYFHPQTTVITTTTVNDTELSRISLDHELTVISKFKPTYHIPADYPVYQDLDDDTRRQRLEQSLTGTREFATRIGEHTETPSATITPIPLIKGLTPAERDPSYRLAAALDAPLVAYYCTQYFTNGYRKDELLTDLSAIASELPAEMPLLLVGILAESVLSEAPDQVVAAAGLNQWFRPLTPTTDSPSDITRTYTDVADRVHDALALPSPAPLTRS